MNPKAVGEKSEGIVLAELVKLGKVVLLPFGNNQRFDLVVCDETKFVRVQVKTGCLRKGCVSFRPCSTNGFTGEHRDYQGNADLFAVYCPETDKVYWVPVSKTGRSTTFLRVDPVRAKGNQKTIRWAKDYELYCGIEQK